MSKAKMRKVLRLAIALIVFSVVFNVLLNGAPDDTVNEAQTSETTISNITEETPELSEDDIVEMPSWNRPSYTESTEADSSEPDDGSYTSNSVSFGIDDIPEYSGDPWIYINANVPFFTNDEITTNSFEDYSPLDDLGRCGTAFACLSTDTQPKAGEERGSISGVYPSGWKTNGKSNNHKYEFVDGSYIYNRCHLIMWALSAENANNRNLITGTRYLNIEGMLPWETQCDEYVDQTDNHLMYRVTPIFDGDNLVADGVLMEAYSVEDNGDGVQFCIYAYNVQPGVEIDYATGENWLAS